MLSALLGAQVVLVHKFKCNLQVDLCLPNSPFSSVAVPKQKCSRVDIEHLIKMPKNNNCRSRIEWILLGLGNLGLLKWKENICKSLPDGPNTTLKF